MTGIFDLFVLIEDARRDVKKFISSVEKAANTAEEGKKTLEELIHEMRQSRRVFTNLTREAQSANKTMKEIQSKGDELEQAARLVSGKMDREKGERKESKSIEVR